MLFNDDCLNVLKDLPAERVDLIYLDPPFFTQKYFSIPKLAVLSLIHFTVIIRPPQI